MDTGNCIISCTYSKNFDGPVCTCSVVPSSYALDSVHATIHNTQYTHTHTQSQTRMMALVPDPKARYKNLVEAFYKIVTQENPRALFRGITVVLSGAGPAHALYFSCYEYAKNLLSQGSRSSVLAQGMC